MLNTSNLNRARHWYGAWTPARETPKFPELRGPREDDQLESRESLQYLIPSTGSIVIPLLAEIVIFNSGQKSQ